MAGSLLTGCRSPVYAADRTYDFRVSRPPVSEAAGPASAGDHASVEVLLAAADALLDPCALLDAVRDSSGRVVDFCYRHVNQAACEQFGLSRQELTGRGMVEVTPGGKTLLPACIRCLETGEPLVVNDFYYDGEVSTPGRRYDLRATRATSSAIVLTWRDVTDRFHMAQRLAASEARFHRAMDNAAVGMCLMDSAGRVEEVNAALCAFLGYDAETLREKTWQQVIGPESLEVNQNRIKDMVSGRIESYRMVNQYLHADGHWIWGDHSVSCIRDKNGWVENVLIQVVDVTPVERELRERLEFEEFLWGAITDGHLVVYAQPIVDAHTGQLVEEELLVRIVRTDGQVMVPDEFLPQARRFGMMPTIDRFMVARAVELARAGRRVAVNLSAASINDAATMAAIIEELREAGEVAALVSCEITEHTALASTDLAQRFSDDMRGLGCRLALDDFGTGFGSFTELRGMTLHTLKIDQSFVTNLTRNPHDEAAVRAIVSIAAEFGLRTTAEGVEDIATRNRLVELGVDQLQGYLIGRPAPAMTTGSHSGQ